MPYSVREYLQWLQHNGDFKELEGKETQHAVNAIASNLRDAFLNIQETMLAQKKGKVSDDQRKSVLHLFLYVSYASRLLEALTAEKKEFKDAKEVYEFLYSDFEAFQVMAEPTSPNQPMH